MDRCVKNSCHRSENLEEEKKNLAKMTIVRTSCIQKSYYRLFYAYETEIRTEVWTYDLMHCSNMGDGAHISQVSY